MTQQRRVAIIVCNLGGPDGPDAVRPFLFNLFNDKAIIAAPQPMRFALAQLISRTREQSAKANYALMGGGSPIVPETEKQARALDAHLQARRPDIAFKSFLAMRYWKPFPQDAARAAQAWGATEAVVLPLYPQFSSTTSRSSIEAWRKASALPSTVVCCFPAGETFAHAHADAILAAWRDGGSPASPRVLFSAHGLPQRVVDAGDPYQWQVEQTVASVKPRLPADWEFQICYQSRVGPLTWIGPSTEEEIERAAEDKRGVIVSPIAFVSEHIETLVELDVEYAEKAKALGVPFYLRAAALGAADRFIAALADQVERALEHPGATISEAAGRLCPAQFGLCAHS
ncbi:MAG: ferrochelatase [Alphaproteobacteria bacterium]|nr:ferrochelatase [Alphaproteobacteria bacterium]